MPNAQVYLVIFFMMLQAIFLGLAITYSLVAIRGIGQFIVRIAKGEPVSMGSSVFITPGIYWTLFFFSTTSKNLSLLDSFNIF